MAKVPPNAFAAGFSVAPSQALEGEPESIQLPVCVRLTNPFATGFFFGCGFCIAASIFGLLVAIVRA